MACRGLRQTVEVAPACRGSRSRLRLIRIRGLCYLCKRGDGAGGHGGINRLSGDSQNESAFGRRHFGRPGEATTSGFDHPLEVGTRVAWPISLPPSFFPSLPFSLSPSFLASLPPSLPPSLPTSSLPPSVPPPLHPLPPSPPNALLCVCLPLFLLRSLNFFFSGLLNRHHYATHSLPLTKPSSFPCSQPLLQRAGAGGSVLVVCMYIMYPASYLHVSSFAYARIPMVSRNLSASIPVCSPDCDSRYGCDDEII